MMFWFATWSYLISGHIIAKTRPSRGYASATCQHHWGEGSATSRHQWHHPLHRKGWLEQALHSRHVPGLHCKSPHCATESQRHHHLWHCWHGCWQRCHHCHTAHDLQLQVSLFVLRSLDNQCYYMRLQTNMLRHSLQEMTVAFLYLLLLSVMLSYIRRGESHWWMKGSTPPQIAEIIIKLVKDMAAVSFLCFPLSFFFCFSWP